MMRCDGCGKFAAPGWIVLDMATDELTPEGAWTNVRSSAHGPGTVTKYPTAHAALRDLAAVMEQHEADGLSTYMPFGHLIHPVPYCPDCDE